MAIVNLITQNDCDFFRGFSYVTSVTDPVTNITTTTPFDLTGADLQMGVRTTASDAQEPLFLSISNGGIIVNNAPGGLFTLNITQAQLLALPVGVYVHSLIRVYTYPDRTFRYLVWTGSLTNNAGPSR